CACVQDVAGKGYQDDIGTDHACHHGGVGDTQGANLRLPLEIGETFFEVGVNGEGEAGFGDFGIAAGFEGFGGGFGGVGIFVRVALLFARRNVDTTDLIEAEG